MPAARPFSQFTLRLRDGRGLDPMPVADALGLVGAVVAARSTELLPAAA
ncbi:hypothetical protein AB0F73_12980 [Micromonospora purpureochromogenes]